MRACFSLCLTIVAIAGVTTWADEPSDSAAGDAPAPYVLTGDLPDVQKKGTIRFGIPEAEYLPRNGDPSAAEQDLARAFADKLGVKSQFIALSRDQLIDQLNAGRIDMVVASMGITPERAAKMAFSRPVRFVQQIVAVNASNNDIHALGDLAGKEVAVRPSSAYASALKQAQQQVPTLKIKSVPESTDTFDLLQAVARGEEAVTVADSDIFEAVHTVEPNLKAAFVLNEKDPIAWGIRKNAAKLKAAVDAFLVEKAMTSHKENTYKADFDEIQKRGVLRVLTRNSSTTYFLYRGEQLGFEYELARELAKSLGVRLEISVPPSREALLEYLESGKGDLIAAGMSITPEREKTLLFSRPYQTVSELLVVPASDKTTKSIVDLKGRKISVRKSSSYYETLSKLKDANGFTLEALPEDLETEDILQQVGEGKIGATVADSNIVDIELTYNSKIHSVGPIGDEQSIAWAMRKDQPKLKAAVDAFIKKTYKGVFYNVTLKKYFKSPKALRTTADEKNALKDGQISQWDPLAKKWAKQFEMDWRLVLSHMYQESHFDPKAKSWVGALGLMQVMPRTAHELKIDDVVTPDPGVHAGVLLLSRYAKMFDGDQLKEKDRIRFAMASYNCGPGHVHDARRLARDMKLNPDKWFGNVEKAMVLLSDPKFAKQARHGYCRCGEPVKYVSEIQTRYEAYSQMVPLE